VTATTRRPIVSILRCERIARERGGERRAAATPQAARGWAHPRYSHSKIQSCCCLGSAFEVAAFHEVSDAARLCPSPQPAYIQAVD
jgi:hypothetical protein